MSFIENVTKTAKVIGKSLYARRGGILTGIGLAGVITGAILTGAAAIKAEKAIQQKKEEIELKEDESLTMQEKAACTWKIFLPAVLIEAAGCAAIIGGCRSMYRKNAALAAAYTLSETALSDYINKVTETLIKDKIEEIRQTIRDEKPSKPITEEEIKATAEKYAKEKVEEIQKSVIQDKITENAPHKEVVFVREKDGTIYYDALSGRYFMSNPTKINAAISRVNDLLTLDSVVTVNEFYDEVDLPHNELGEALGWDIENGKLRVAIDPMMAEDGTPCLAISFRHCPPKPCYPY